MESEFRRAKTPFPDVDRSQSATRYRFAVKTGQFREFRQQPDVRWQRTKRYGWDSR